MADQNTAGRNGEPFDAVQIQFRGAGRRKVRAGSMTGAESATLVEEIESIVKPCRRDIDIGNAMQGCGSLPVAGARTHSVDAIVCCDRINRVIIANRGG